MLTLAVIGVFTGLLLLFVYSVVVVLVHPICTIIELHRDPELTQSKKLVWVILISSLPLLSLAYGLFVTKSKLLWRFSATLLTMLVLMGIGFTYIPTSYKELVKATFTRQVASE